MIKKLIVSVAFLVSSVSGLLADEGMWFLMSIERLNQRDMEKMGLQLTPEEIYSINNTSLKDAIVQFNGGCTASIISKEGLVLTNHHCGYDAIAELSDPENNYLKNGFWAESKEEELKPKSLFVRFFVRMDNVTDRILSKVTDDMDEKERERVVNMETARIQKEHDEGGKYTVSVRPFFQGNEYYYFVYQDYKDVRLVGTPTESIGKFGGDTDNWEWPRHTGDFSLFRVYADSQGNPAEYSIENVPLKPKYHLSINAEGYQENDFAMILGYPGRTNRWMPAEGVEQNVKYAYPAWVEGSKLGMDKMKVYMDKDPEIRLKYASKYASVANYWKNRQGMIDALTLHGTANSKREEERKFQKWSKGRENKKEYGGVLKEINNYYKLTNEKARHDNYLISLLRTSTYGQFPYVLGSKLLNYAASNDAKRQELRPEIVESIDAAFENIHLPLEKDVLASQLNLYAEKSEGYPIAPLVNSIGSANDNNFTSFIENAFEKSVFTSKAKLLAYLDDPEGDLINKDPLFRLSTDFIRHYNQKSEKISTAENNYQKAFRSMVAGLRKANPDAKYYPDANLTLRLTYGKIRALPEDTTNDAKENYYTTLKGMVAKYKPGDEEFDLPKELIELEKEGNFEEYQDKDGYMPVNFLTDNDITGGNSGSPVLNGNGELIGLAFDGNIEAIAGDVIFDHELQRTINVDIRFFLLVMDKLSGASHLIDELTIIWPETVEAN